MDGPVLLENIQTTQRLIQASKIVASPLVPQHPLPIDYGTIEQVRYEKAARYMLAVRFKILSDYVQHQ